jgi:hypothetical protein
MGFQLIFAVCLVREPEGDALGRSEAEHGDLYYRSRNTTTDGVTKAHPRPRVASLASAS